MLSGIGIPSPGGGGGGGGDSGGGGGGISLPDIPDGGNFSRLSGLEGMAAADASGGGVTYNIDIRETDVALTEERLIDTLSRVEYLYR